MPQFLPVTQLLNLPLLVKDIYIPNIPIKTEILFSCFYSTHTQMNNNTKVIINSIITKSENIVQQNNILTLY